jgi:hypothetical protein
LEDKENRPRAEIATATSLPRSLRSRKSHVEFSVRKPLRIQRKLAFNMCELQWVSFVGPSPFLLPLRLIATTIGIGRLAEPVAEKPR